MYGMYGANATNTISNPFIQKPSKPNEVKNTLSAESNDNLKNFNVQNIFNGNGVGVHGSGSSGGNSTLCVA